MVTYTGTMGEVKMGGDGAKRTLIAGLLLAVTAMLVFGWVAEGVLHGQTQRFDDAVRMRVHALANPVLTEAMRGLSFIGSPSFLMALGALTVFLYVRSGRPRTAILFVVAVIGAEFLDQVLKMMFHRTRPVAFFGLAEPIGYSFPSGHSLVSCVFFGVLAAFAGRRTDSKARQLGYYAAAALVIAGIGFSRIYLGVHYLSDVFAGYVAAIVWVFSVRTARQWIRQRAR